MNQKTKTILKSFFILVLFAFSIRALAVWTNPTVAPTGGNATPPINVGNITQQKEGIFASNGLRSFGSTRLDSYVGIGTDSSPAYMLDVAGGARLTQLDLTSGAARTIKIADRTNDGSGSSLTIAAGKAIDSNLDGFKGGNLYLVGGGNTTGGDIGNVVIANNGGKLCLGDTTSCIGSWSEIGGGTGGTSQWVNATGGINYAAGNVGIGTTTPNAKLDISVSNYVL